jgi:hypothetical protein
MQQSKSTYALAGSAAMYFANSTYQGLCLGTFHIHGVNILCNFVKLYSTEEYPSFSCHSSTLCQ